MAKRCGPLGCGQAATRPTESWRGLDRFSAPRSAPRSIPGRRKTVAGLFPPSQLPIGPNNANGLNARAFQGFHVPLDFFCEVVGHCGVFAKPMLTPKAEKLNGRFFLTRQAGGPVLRAVNQSRRRGRPWTTRIMAPGFPPDRAVPDARRCRDRRRRRRFQAMPALDYTLPTVARGTEK